MGRVIVPLTKPAGQTPPAGTGMMLLGDMSVRGVKPIPVAVPGGCDRDCAGTGICLSVTCSAGAVYSECTTHRKESSAKQKYRKLSLSIDLAIFSRYGLTPIEIKRIFTHGLSLHF